MPYTATGESFVEDGERCLVHEDPHGNEALTCIPVSDEDGDINVESFTLPDGRTVVLDEYGNQIHCNVPEEDSCWARYGISEFERP